MRNMCETCGGGSEFFLGKINFLLDSTPQKSANAVALYGAGIGFLQRSCKAEGGYGAKVLPSGGAQEAGWEQPWCRNNPPADQEDTVEWVKVA